MKLRTTFRTGPPQKIHCLLPLILRMAASGGNQNPGGGCPTYTPPAGNNVICDFTMVYSAPSGNNVQVDFCTQQ
ncbi:MAG: hypothetical protein ACREAU_00730 [Nitrosopumilaceae archaeon]